MAKYPLEPLARVRANEVDEAARALAAAIAARAAAEARVAESREAEARFSDMAADVARRESLALASGVLRVADLAQGAAFRTGASREREALLAAVDAALRSLAEARAGEDRARARLADRKAQADAVERDRAKFVAGERRALEAKEEEAAEEMRGAAVAVAQRGRPS
jgi:hypothetical protein